VGEEARCSADVRVVTASNVPLGVLADRGEFRRDLLFRLDVLSLELPPLRERRSDVPQLAVHLLAKAARAEGGEVKRLTPAAIERLEAYPWPGNVRELEHVLLRAHLLTSDPVIAEEDLLRSSPALRGVTLCACAGAGMAEAPIDHGALRELKRRAADEVERRFVEEALARAGNLSQAARLCHMERAAFSKLAKKVRAGGHASPVAG
jgi:DNA-binding NtrC family response regulator